MWHRLITLIKKEFQALLRNPQSRIILFMPVIMQLILFPFAASLEVKNSTIAIYNQDTGAAAIELMQRLSATQAFPNVIIVHNLRDMTETIDRQHALIGVIIPSDFSRNLHQQNPADVQVVIDGRRSNAAQIVFGYTQNILTQFISDITGKAQPVDLIVRNDYNPNLDYKWFILPSLIGIILTIGTLIITALSIAREKEEGTFEQLLVSPLTPAYIMIGKAIPAIIVALLQGSVIWAAAMFVYGIPFLGSALLLFVSMFVYSLSLIGFGLFISSICANQQQAFLASFSFMTPSVVLSGYMAPVENMPAFLQAVSLANPLRHIIVLAKGIFLKNYDLSLAWPHIWPLLLIAFISTTIATIQFYRKIA